jgi:energy-coupling factor transporter ATP-binding protein EcfA2
MKVHVRNFQSLHAVDLDVEGLTVIVGPSNRGKSALLRAIEAALFNAPGDEFVTTGQKTAEVHLGDVPTADGRTLDVLWAKGGGKNAYNIDGQSYAKVGTGAPPVLQEAGYRDVWVGDKDRKRGESIRPQAANQFDGLFLLNRAGSFVADVLGLLSRQRTVALAQGRAASDLRSAKQVLGIRESDLQQVLSELAGFEGLDARASAIHGLGNRLQLLQGQLDALSGLARHRIHRQQLTRWLALPLPPSAYNPAVWDAGERLGQLRALHARRTNTLYAAKLVLPDPAPKRWSMQDKVMLRTLTGLRARRPAAVPDLPPASPPLTLHGVGPAPAVVVPSVFRRFLGDLQALGARRRDLLNGAFALKGQLTNLTVELEEAQGRLAAMKAELKVCPACGRPAAA